jgi:hypothetical protein
MIVVDDDDSSVASSSISSSLSDDLKVFCWKDAKEKIPLQQSTTATKTIQAICFIPSSQTVH